MNPETLQIVEAAFRGFASGLRLVTAGELAPTTFVPAAPPECFVPKADPAPAVEAPKKSRAKKEAAEAPPAPQAAPTPPPMGDGSPSEIDPPAPAAPALDHDAARRQLQEICTVRPDGLAIARDLIKARTNENGKLTDIPAADLAGFLAELSAKVAA